MRTYRSERSGDEPARIAAGVSASPAPVRARFARVPDAIVCGAPRVAYLRCLWASVAL
jgi:hypothetical protein